METRKMWLVLSGLAMVSCAEGVDSSGNGDGAGDDGGSGDESDADTDADSDTDTDTDADTASWDADVIFLYAQFGYDAKRGEIVDASWAGETLDNLVTATVMDLDRYLED